MLVSRCCKSTLWVFSGNESNSFYVCDDCQRACDTLWLSKLITDNQHYDARNKSKASAFLD